MTPTKPAFVHICIAAADWRKLSSFYMEVFDLVQVPPKRHLRGDWFEKATKMEHATADGIHLMLRGELEPKVTLEILQFNPEGTESSKAVNSLGLSHFAFRVDDINSSLQKVIGNGGAALGEMVTREIEGAGTVTFIYVRDPEGNILEPQRWDQ